MVTWNDFDRIWASTSPLTPYEFSEPNYSQGWNFVGSTPPARQMWDSIQKKNDEKFKYLRDNFGTPNIVTQASQMTDTEKVYVYIGSEAGWNSGHWYYYDEGTSSWADGGVYNSVAFVTDTTLSIAGQPADAKAVGDALALKADLAGCTFTGNVNVNANFSVIGTSTIANADVTDITVSGNAYLNGNSTAITQPIDDNSTKVATTEYVQNEVKPIETDITINDKRITNIEKLLQGNLYDYQTDSTSAYTKSVPAGAMPYAGLEQIGGKTVVWNQLVQNGNFVDSTGWAPINGTISIGDGVATLTAGSSGSFMSGITYLSSNTIVGHKYYCSVNMKTNYQSNSYFSLAGVRTAENSVNYRYPPVDTWYRVHGIITPDISTSGIYIMAARFDDCIAQIKNVMFVDLTEMFGAGNEPSTVEEFQQMFPADWYAYNEGTLLSAGVTEVVSKDGNNATLQTYSIPAEIQALEGYGWSAGTAYNYVDYERKVFVQNVGSRAYASGDESDSTVITDGTTTYYPLTTAVETDISEYLTDDNLINVESGGTLTFLNSNGTDYQIPVPSEETYMIDLQSAL